MNARTSKQPDFHIEYKTVHSLDEAIQMHRSGIWDYRAWPCDQISPWKFIMAREVPNEDEPK